MPRLHLTRALIRLVVIVTVVALLLVGVWLTPKYHERQPQNLSTHREDDVPYIVLDLEIRSCSIQNLDGCRATGDWYKVPKPLGHDSQGKPWSELARQYLFVKKKRIDQLGDEGVMVDFEMVENVGDGATPGRAWNFKKLKYDKSDPEDRYYYNVDVLFGNDAVDPRPGWQLFKEKPILGTKGEIPAYLTFRQKATPPKHERTKLRVEGEHFKILQVADLHFSTHEGVCRDQFPEVPNCKADSRTLSFVKRVLDIENPDLVMLTGDQIFGDDSFDSVTTILKVVAPFIEKRIPYAMMFGNHDDEGSLSRAEIMEIVQHLPYSLSIPGPENIDGVGNYVFQAETETEPIITFYVLDSHKYSQAPKVNPGYDWIKANQLTYIRELKSMINTKSTDHLSFGFFHIPLPEFRKAANMPFVGNYKEGVMAPKYNTHARDVMAELGVQVISVGHDHCNDYCLLDNNEEAKNKVWLCYGGGAGEGGYGGYGGTTRRLRIFDVEVQTATVRSYKRLETSPEETFDHQLLVNNGVVQ